MFEPFIPTSFTAVCHTSLIASAEHEQPVVNDLRDSLADVVFIRLFGVSVFGIHSPFGFQMSFSLSCVFAHSCKHRLTCYSWRRKLKTLLFFHVRALKCFYLKWSQYKRNRVNCPASKPTRTRSKRAQKSSVLLKFFRYGKTQRIHKQGKKGSKLMLLNSLLPCLHIWTLSWRFVFGLYSKPDLLARVYMYVCLSVCACAHKQIYMHVCACACSTKFDQAKHLNWHLLWQ